MDDLTVSLLVVLGTGLVVAFIFLAVARAKKQKLAQIQQLAREKGWAYEAVRERLGAGYRLRGPGWTFEALTTSTGGPEAEGSSNVTSSTRWESDRAALPGHTLLIGERVGHPALGPLADTLLQQALKMILGDEAADAEGLSEIPAGSQTFQQRYMLWATDPADAERVLTPQVERVLLDWPLKPLPIVRLTPRGLRIDILHRRVEDLKEVEAIITLGKLLMVTED